MCALHYNLYPLKVYRINLKFYTIHCKKIKPKGNTNQVLVRRLAYSLKIVVSIPSTDKENIH